MFSSAEKIFADHRFYLVASILIRDLLDLSLRGKMECLIVCSSLNETVLKIFRDYRVSFNFEWISNDLWETCVCWIYVRELFFIFFG